MKSTSLHLKSLAMISFLIILPLMVLEILNRRDLSEAFPFVLFGVLWLLPVLFILTGMPIIRTIRAGNPIVPNPVLVLRALLFAFLVWMWLGIVMDQMPCFLGVPNCD